jgi:hypothetical protein
MWITGPIAALIVLTVTALVLTRTRKPRDA